MYYASLLKFNRGSVQDHDIILVDNEYYQLFINRSAHRVLYNIINLMYYKSREIDIKKEMNLHGNHFMVRSSIYDKFVFGLYSICSQSYLNIPVTEWTVIYLLDCVVRGFIRVDRPIFDDMTLNLAGCASGFIWDTYTYKFERVEFRVCFKMGLNSEPGYDMLYEDECFMFHLNMPDGKTVNIIFDEFSMVEDLVNIVRYHDRSIMHNLQIRFSYLNKNSMKRRYIYPTYKRMLSNKDRKAISQFGELKVEILPWNGISLRNMVGYFGNVSDVDILAG